ncbi:uncharacterized protein LOC111694336 [Trichogramma pretiosum]|uniref:uncharacterized protein LOC111694336 n=1 Tax=Trichogramma pretiosum TaxID=7493 RepID=UPI000C719922|nr:uncharacterized protein LOC111694336 [Trichogramma pretiosum]
MSSNTSNDNSNAILQDEEDVVLEGSALHQALTSLGYNNFDYIPRYRAECSTIESDSQNPETYESNWYQNRSSVWQYFFQDDKLKMRYLEIIANSNVLLDDHALAIQGFFRDPSPSVYKQVESN